MNRLRRRWWHLREDEEAMSLVEVLIAIFVLGVAIMALGSIGLSSLIQLRMTRDREQATNAGSAAIEHVRAFDFGDIAHDPNSGIDLTDTDQLPGPLQDEIGVDGAECVDGEPLVTDAAAPQFVPLHQKAGNRDAIDLYTIVTYADGGCDPETTSDLKRVISLARFVDGSRVEWVRQETLVASAGRGLPVPNFRLRPETQSLTFTPADTDNKTPRCRDHQLRNLGADDTYEWELISFDGEQTKSPVGKGWHPHNKPWEVSAYLQKPESSSGGTPPDEEHRVDDVDSATGRFASDVEVETGESATFTVCYHPTGSVQAANFDVEVEVYSRFDDRKFTTLNHNITVEDPGEAYYLLDREDSVAHARHRDDDGQIRPSLLARNVTVGGSAESLERIGDIDYSDPDLSDWSTEVNDDEPTVPGIRLPNSASASDDERTADWRYQISPSRTLRSTPTPRLVLWTAPTSALVPGTVPEDGLPMRLDIRLDGLRSNENQNPFWGGVVHSLTYTHTSPGWQRHEVDLPIGGDQSFQNNRRLRLQISCHETSAEDCNLAYDNDQYRSRLHLEFTQ